jgi:hypothetical protein
VIETVEQARALIESAVAHGAAPAARERFEAGWPYAIALGSHDPAAREQLRDLIPALTAVEEELEGAGWLALLLGVLHEEPFVAIEFPSRRGVAGRMSGVVDNFQLQTLLMDVFDQRVSPAAVANARGDGPQQLDETVTGAWNLYGHGALRDRALPPPDFKDTTYWIWNEGTPSDIPVVADHRVLLLGPPAYQRSWGAARTFAALPATLEPRSLSDQEVDEWLTRIERA